MNKTQREKLKQFVDKEFPEKLTRYSYYDGECFCAVGALMTKANPEYDFELVNGRKENKNRIDSILYDEQSPFYDLANEVVNEFGLSESDLRKIQSENDNFYPSDEYEHGYEVSLAKHMKKVIKKIIKNKNNEGVLT